MREERPWGYFEVLYEEIDSLKVKKLVVSPGQRLSLQAHRHRNEYWIVLFGEATVSVDSDVDDRCLKAGDSIYIPAGKKHRLSNFALVERPFIVLEIQTGVCVEDDINRFEDDYGRVDA